MGAGFVKISAVAEGANRAMILINVGTERREVQAMLARIDRRAKNLRPVMRVVGQVVRSSVVRNFMVGGRPEKWEPSQRVKRKGGKTLVRRGRLRDSIKSRAFPDHVEVGTNVKYAIFHQLGTKHMVSRPFLLVQEEDWPEIDAAFARHILRR